MSELTHTQRKFLQKQKIPLSVVFDADGLSARERRAEMRAIGAVVFIGGTPCKKGGHTLRTAAGHCVQCDTSKLAYQQRVRQSGEIYVAKSDKHGLVKIGTTIDIDRRIQGLRSIGYGGADDWEVTARFHSANAGRVELDAHSYLRAFQVDREYQRDGRLVVARELFRTSSRRAENAVIRAIAK